MSEFTHKVLSDGNVCPVLLKFQFQNKEGSWKKFPISASSINESEDNMNLSMAFLMSLSIAFLINYIYIKVGHGLS